MARGGGGERMHKRLLKWDSTMLFASVDYLILFGLLPVKTRRPAGHRYNPISHPFLTDEMKRQSECTDKPRTFSLLKLRPSIIEYDKPAVSVMMFHNPDRIILFEVILDDYDNIFDSTEEIGSL